MDSLKEKGYNKMKNRTDNYFSLLFLLLVGVFFYMLNTNVSLRNDDYMYSFMYVKDSVSDIAHPLDLTHPIKSAGDLFISQYNHYFSMNGRSIVHFVVQLFCGIWGKNVFNICTSLIYIALIIGIVRLVFPIYRTVFHYIGVSLVLWFLLPVSAFYAMGICFAVNYLWSLTACIWFLFFYRKVKNGCKLSPKEYAVILFMSFLAGWSHESFAIGISGALFIYYLIHMTEFKGREKYLAIVFCLGTSMLILSPGIWVRFTDVNGQAGWLDFLYSRLGVLLLMKRLLLLIMVLFVLVISKQIRIKDFIEKNRLFCLILCVEVLFIMTVGFVNERSMLGIDFFSILLLLCALTQSRLAYRRHWKYVSVALLVGFIYINMGIIRALSLVDKEFSLIVRDYLADDNGVTFQKDLRINPYFYKYVCRLYPGSWEISSVSSYYGKTMHLYPASYKNYFSHISSFLLPENKVSNGSGLYEIPQTGIYIALVDLPDKEFFYKFEYAPVAAKNKYAASEIWKRDFYKKSFDTQEVKVRPFKINGMNLIFIDQGIYKERDLKRVTLK